MMRNNDPSAPWNDPRFRDDPSAPHNDPTKRDDPSKPWNSPSGSVNDLNRGERHNYGMPEDED